MYLEHFIRTFPNAKGPTSEPSPHQSRFTRHDQSAASPLSDESSGGETERPGPRQFPMRLVWCSSQGAVKDNEELMQELLARSLDTKNTSCCYIILESASPRVPLLPVSTTHVHTMIFSPGSGNPDVLTIHGIFSSPECAQTQ
ncbi:hypothetical protein BD779DRAFT_871723 [Infundibulicybe gibba]|nr:hypothetical protein BD779DRAFT_871723 [Infundibulicybe gibba]